MFPATNKALKPKRIIKQVHTVTYRVNFRFNFLYGLIYL